MRSLLFVPLVLLLVAADKPEDDAKKLQGNWSVESFTKEGKKLPEDETKKMEVIIKDDTLTAVRGERKEPGTFKLDSTKKPKTMDLTPAKESDKKVLFIDELNGDTLKLCWNAGTDRPTAFDAEKVTGLLVLKRKK